MIENSTYTEGLEIKHFCLVHSTLKERIKLPDKGGVNLKSGGVAQSAFSAHGLGP